MQIYLCGCPDYSITHRFRITFHLSLSWRKEASYLDVASSTCCDYLSKPPEDGRVCAAPKITLQEQSVPQATRLFTMEGSVPRELAWGHGEGVIQISSRVNRRILRTAPCPKGGLKAGGFTLCPVAAITAWQPRARQGHSSRPQPLTSRNKL